jgi:metal-responsive CopG/Arc/MetJ family transcriptional regulator
MPRLKLYKNETGMISVGFNFKLPQSILSDLDIIREETFRTRSEAARVLLIESVLRWRRQKKAKATDGRS